MSRSSPVGGCSDDGDRVPLGTWELRLLLIGVVGLGVLAVANLLWLHHYRFGLPFNIDEAGYLQRSTQYQQALDAGSVRQLLTHWQTPDIVAPILPLVAGTVDSVLHLSPWGTVGVEQVFYILTVSASYLLARTRCSVRWALVTSLVVAAMPGLIDSSRLYFLSTPAAALFMWTLYLQVRTRGFERLGRATAWGASLGLLCLTRSMAVALAPAFVVVALPRAWSSKDRRIALRNATVGTGIALLVALSWYWTSWHAVYRYLTQYGYGSQASFYTGSKTLSLPERVQTRIVNVVSQDLFLPLLLAVLLCTLLGAGAVWRGRTSHSPRRPAERSSWKRCAKELYGWVDFDVVAVMAITTAVLCSTSNSGSYFELPLVPAGIVLVVPLLARTTRKVKPVAVGMLAAAVAITLVDQFGLIPSLSRLSSVSVGKVSVVAFNDDQADFVGPKLRQLGLGGVYWSNCGGATITCFFGRTSGITVRYLEQWNGVNRAVEQFVYSYGESHGYQPVVFFAYQGPLLNTNTVGLASQLGGRTLPIGALLPPPLRQGQGLRSQLESPLLGQPNFVVAEGPGPSGEGQSESSPVLQREVDVALSGDGFRVVREFQLPGAPSLEVWWKDR